MADRKAPLVLGEIQFGNWGLFYYDMFKVLKADAYTNINLMVYVTPTGELTEHLSEGIVTFENARSEIESSAAILKIPIWLIGIDVKNFS